MKQLQLNLICGALFLFFHLPNSYAGPCVSKLGSTHFQESSQINSSESKLNKQMESMLSISKAYKESSYHSRSSHGRNQSSSQISSSFGARSKHSSRECFEWEEVEIDPGAALENLIERNFLEIKQILDQQIGKGTLIFTSASKLKEFFTSLLITVDYIEKHKKELIHDQEQGRFIWDTSLPFSLRVLPTHEIVINFDSLSIGRGAFKSLFLSINYDRGILHKPSALLARSETDITEMELNEFEFLKEEVLLQQRLSQQSSIVKITDYYFSTIDGHQYFSMVQEFYEEGNLQDFKNSYYTPASQGTLITRIQLNIFSSLLNQLRWIHSHHVAHGDIKPENILVRFLSNHTLDVGISDFGSATDLLKIDTTPDSIINPFRGTLHFVSPELLKRSFEENLDLPKSEILKKGDVWAMGLTLYSLMNGKDHHSGCRIPETNSLAIPAFISTINNYDDLCSTCQIFCDPNRKTAPPEAGTPASVVYEMLNPNPTARISVEEALYRVERLTEWHSSPSAASLLR